MTTGRHIREKDLKVLCGLSGGRCAFPNCNCKLVAFAKGEKCPIGAMAHIINIVPMPPLAMMIIFGGNISEKLFLLVHPITRL